MGRSVKAHRFADHEQGDFMVAVPGAPASDTPLVEVKALLRSHGEQEDRLSCTLARAALPASRFGVVWRFLSTLPLLLLPPIGQPEFHRR